MIESKMESEDIKLERLVQAYNKKHEALIKSKKNLVWKLAGISNEEKQALEKRDRRESLDSAESEIWAKARSKIEDAKTKFKDLLDLPEII